MVISHSIEPFVALAARALTLRDGRIEEVQPLPEEPGVRLALIDRLARGG